MDFQSTARRCFSSILPIVACLLAPHVLAQYSQTTDLLFNTNDVVVVKGDIPQKIARIELIDVGSGKAIEIVECASGKRRQVEITKLVGITAECDRRQKHKSPGAVGMLMETGLNVYSSDLKLVGIAKVLDFEPSVYGYEKFVFTSQNGQIHEYSFFDEEVFLATESEDGWGIVIRDFGSNHDDKPEG